MFIVLRHGQTKRLTMGKSRIKSSILFPINKVAPLPPTPPPGFRYFCREGNKHEGKIN